VVSRAAGGQLSGGPQRFSVQQATATLLERRARAERRAKKQRRDSSEYKERTVSKAWLAAPRDWQ
jgi:hypothetical protein